MREWHKVRVEDNDGNWAESEMYFDIENKYEIDVVRIQMCRKIRVTKDNIKSFLIDNVNM